MIKNLINIYIGFPQKKVKAFMNVIKGRDYEGLRQFFVSKDNSSAAKVSALQYIIYRNDDTIITYLKTH